MQLRPQPMALGKPAIVLAVLRRHHPEIHSLHCRTRMPPPTVQLHISQRMTSHTARKDCLARGEDSLDSPSPPHDGEPRCRQGATALNRGCTAPASIRHQSSGRCLTPFPLTQPSATYSHRHRRKHLRWRCHCCPRTAKPSILLICPPPVLTIPRL